MSNCYQHDWVDWLAAIGPTLATVFAGIATVHVYLRGERFQRKMVRPLIAIRQHLSHDTNFWRWRIELRNEGQGAANIESFTIVARDEIRLPDLSESTIEYWTRVLNKLGASRIEKLDGNIFAPPLAIGAGASLLIFDALIPGQRQDIDRIVSRLEIKGTYTSVFGDAASFRSRFDRD